MGKCIDDFLSFTNIKDEEVLSGTYYSKRPLTPQDAGKNFSYDIVNENDRAFSKVLDNLRTVKSLQTIKTNDMCGFKVNGYVVTQDETLWQIQGIIKRVVNPENKQALRLLKETNETEYVLRLSEVINPWGLK
jgi:hypothetical protein